MYSVTRRISMIKQPRGGYINRKDFTINALDDGTKLNDTENIHPILVGLAVDYMTRFSMGTPIKEAFSISLKGAVIAKELYNANKLLSEIHGLDYKSIVYACKLVGYDVCFRKGMIGYKPVEEINPDKVTADNIVTMIKRSQSFWKLYGPIVKDGFTFEGGYTPIISSGDGDYLSTDTLWDFKVLKDEIKPKHSLQLLIYYIMGQHSVHKEFVNIKRLGIYNPRLNKIYMINVCDIPTEIIDTVSRDIIGYGLPTEEYQQIIESGRKPGKAGLDLLTGNPMISRGMLGGKSGNGKCSRSTSVDYTVGDRVSHACFGEGTVTAMKDTGGDYQVTVAFQGDMTRKMMASFAKLKKI